MRSQSATSSKKAEAFDGRSYLAKLQKASLQQTARRTAEKAEVAMAKAQALAEASVHAASALKFFEAEERVLLEEIRRSRHGQDVQRRMLENRSWRENDHQPLGVTLSQPKLASPRLSSTSRASSAGLKSTASRPRTPKTKPLVIQPIATGGFTGVGKEAVPYWW